MSYGYGRVTVAAQAKSTVTCLNSAGLAAATGTPHSLQNLEFAASPVPQAQHSTAAFTASPRPRPYAPPSQGFSSGRGSDPVTLNTPQCRRATATTWPSAVRSVRWIFGFRAARKCAFRDGLCRPDGARCADRHLRDIDRVLTAIVHPDGVRVNNVDATWASRPPPIPAETVGVEGRLLCVRGLF